MYTSSGVSVCEREGEGERERKKNKAHIDLLIRSARTLKARPAALSLCLGIIECDSGCLSISYCSDCVSSLQCELQRDGLSVHMSELCICVCFSSPVWLLGRGRVPFLRSLFVNGLVSSTGSAGFCIFGKEKKEKKRQPLTQWQGACMMVTLLGSSGSNAVLAYYPKRIECGHRHH